MLPWPERSIDMSSIEHVRDIIGRKRQHHTQLALTIPVLTQQVQQALNSIPPSDIWQLYDTMHALLQACVQSSGGYIGY
ncbi:transposable element Tc1 transposase [Trichonephila clavipes]|nr:transposable element Tc1 transposase [Trichonephila clavipes]